MGLKTNKRVVVLVFINNQFLNSLSLILSLLVEKVKALPASIIFAE